MLLDFLNHACYSSQRFQQLLCQVRLSLYLGTQYQIWNYSFVAKLLKLSFWRPIETKSWSVQNPSLGRSHYATMPTGFIVNCFSGNKKHATMKYKVSQVQLLMQELNLAKLATSSCN